MVVTDAIHRAQEASMGKNRLQRVKVSFNKAPVRPRLALNPSKRTLNKTIEAPPNKIGFNGAIELLQAVIE